MAILVRPVREQLEHDRLIRHLQGKYKRRNEVAMNLGEEQLEPVKISGQTFFPDLVITVDRKLAGIVEVETGESVNDLEARWQWVNFAKTRVPFHLYVPVLSYDSARRLCDVHRASVSEIWTYRPAMDGFDLVRMHHEAVSAAKKTGRVGASVAKANPAKAAPGKPAGAKAKPAKPVKASRAPASKPAGKAKTAAKPKPGGKASRPAKTGTAKARSTASRGTKAKKKR